MRISDWSSDVCSSDLSAIAEHLDLAAGHAVGGEGLGLRAARLGDEQHRQARIARGVGDGAGEQRHQVGAAGVGDPGLCAVDRSEEHTSELQSLMRISYAVFCLKQKNT